jgi:hypothetical protein
MKPDKDELNYAELNVPPPTSETHGTQEDISAQLNQKVRHEWRQRGAVLYCISCPYEHATEPLFLNKILVGTMPDGSPILHDIKKSVQ